MQVGPYNAVKVFSATKAADRDKLGEKVSAWLAERSEVSVSGAVVTLSSDASFHCLTITLFYQEPRS